MRIESCNNYPVFPKWPLSFTINKVIFDEKKFGDFEVLIFSGLGLGLANVWIILGRKIRINCNIEFYLLFSLILTFFHSTYGLVKKGKDEGKMGTY